MIIHQHTKIAAILKHNPASLEAIVSISPQFEKLRNPVLRKLLAGRATLAMASKIGGCSMEDFYTRLAPLGFTKGAETTAAETKELQELPALIKSLSDEQLVVLDVRPVIAAGEDPLSLILQKIKTLQSGQVLKIVNTFEPTPLMLLLKKQGFGAYAVQLDDQLVETWFYRLADTVVTNQRVQTGSWDEMLARYKDNLQTIDVRGLEMPLPMHTILAALDDLPEGKALFVYHKRIPVFLLPELALRHLDYRVKEVANDEVHLLILRN
ncbi:DUF2249 domain-containing protein [Chitinophaga sp.]|uniref:DUF2249 domain-containing protein n=1 Tax=Chitinophaga sp. TaxID=1869181 RepID=UPI0031E04ADA